MAVFSPISSRRSTRRKAEATQQLIVFRLRNSGFALPIKAVQKVIPMDNLYGQPRGAVVGLTLYQEQELIVIDAEYRVFRDVLPLDSSSTRGSVAELLPPDGSEQTVLWCSDRLDASQLEGTQASPQSRYLLIVQNSSGKLVGIPLLQPPSLQRVASSAFAPLTSDYMAEGNLRCVSALIRIEDGEPPLFLLSPEQLVQSQQVLPPA